MLDALSLMHSTLTSLQPGEAFTLSAPLLKPLNRVEAQVAQSLRALVQRLRAGTSASTLLAGHAAELRPPQPLALVPETMRLFDECYAECLRVIVITNRQMLSNTSSMGATPSLSNAEVLLFNALVYSMKALHQHMTTFAERLEEMLALQCPIDLRQLMFV